MIDIERRRAELVGEVVKVERCAFCLEPTEWFHRQVCVDDCCNVVREQVPVCPRCAKVAEPWEVPCLTLHEERLVVVNKGYELERKERDWT